MEYYSFGAWPAIAILLGSGIARAEEVDDGWLPRLQAGLAAIGAMAALCLGYFLWQSRTIPAANDISSLLNYYSIDSYHLSMSHIFDMTSQTFAALRGPSTLAIVAFLLGFGGAWFLRRSKRDLAATITVALAMGVFFFAANWAFGKFNPRMSSRQLADDIFPTCGRRTKSHSTEIWAWDRAFPSTPTVMYGSSMDAWAATLNSGRSIPTPRRRFSMTPAFLRYGAVRTASFYLCPRN